MDFTGMVLYGRRASAAGIRELGEVKNVFV